MVATIGQFLTTITLGLFKTDEEYCAALEKEGFGIGKQARYVMSPAYFWPSTDPVSLDLVTVTGAELGFEERVTYEEICQRAISCGLQLCPAEVGPALRLSQRNQKEDDGMLIGMELLCGYVFDVTHEYDGQRLTLAQGRENATFPNTLVWVFVRPATS